jgi:soluble lytic murein transglycosylase-like protein
MCAPAGLGRGAARPALLALCGLLLGAAPVAAQQQTDAPARDAGSRLLGVRADSARGEAARADAPVGSRGFWTWLRDEARRFRELNGGPFAYARRYRISTELAGDIHRAAEEEGIDPDLAFRLVRVESGFNPRARSYAGALGLTQLMPGTARWLDRRMTTREAILHPERNLRAGFRYLNQLIRQYDGDLRLALLAYNRGHGAVDRDLRRGRDPENGYTRKVLGVGAERYRGSGLLGAR